MRLFIQIRNGSPFEHPIFEDNFLAAFPGIDTENLPPEFARFERVPMPTLSPFDVYEGVTYEFVGDTVKDVHHHRPMTDDEKQTFIEALRAAPHEPDWTFNETLPGWVPPPRKIDITAFGSAPDVTG